ncbi:M23 family metallopeptidase [Sphingomonas sp. HF-S3]|uniref:M23 family metallopeptidase n=1 Tax=Sphingomonas rustica TaxID=3103142 RepID=A0ABV0BF40_9SPHN
MNDRNQDSFDPRTWIPAPPATPPQPPADAGSASASAPERTRPPEPRDPSRTPRGLRGRSPLPIAIGAGALLYLAGAAAAYVSRDDRPAAVAERPALPPAENGAQGFSSRRTLVLAGAGELEQTLLSAGIVADEARDAAARVLGALGTGAGEVRLTFDLRSSGDHAILTALEATRADGAGLVLQRGTDGGFTGRQLSAQLKTRITVVRGEIDSKSFYSSAVSAGVIDSLISDFANAFSFDFDMQREVAPGDIFEVAFERSYNPSGEPVGVPRLVYVSLQTATKSRALYRFVPPGEREAGWFDGNGFSTVRALMRTPVDSARITSQFGMRTHPILGYQKMHRGTDFAAPTGTPIYASGSATVEFAGMKGANGNFVRLRHDNGWETLYLHMNRILPGVEAGAHVSQGQQIGEIGTTGRSTGPHLHYEVHIDGQPVDPLSIETGTGQSLTGSALKAFRKERDRIDAQRAAGGA